MRGDVLSVVCVLVVAMHAMASAADGVRDPDFGRLAYSGTAMAPAMSGAGVPAAWVGEKTVGLASGGGYRGYAPAGFSAKAPSGDGQAVWGMGAASTGRDRVRYASVGWKLPRAAGD